MTTVNRMKRKKPAHVQNANETNQNNTSSTHNFPVQQIINKKYNDKNHSAELQQNYETYYSYFQRNPQGIAYTNTLLPHTAQMFNNYSIPLGFSFSPILNLDNQQAPMMDKSGDKLIRCPNCRAYMNCYNKIQKNKYSCFICYNEHPLDKNYKAQQQQNQQLKSSIFQCYSPKDHYQKQPAQDIFIFLIDITPESASSRMLYYATAAIKQVFSRPQMDDLQVYFFTYDQLVQQYDFNGLQTKCIINDQSIQSKNGNRMEPCLLKQSRQKIFALLDALQDISINNPRKGSNFTKCFNYIFQSLKQTAGKFFIFQCNQAIAGEQMFKQIASKPLTQNQLATKIMSPYETHNKTFFNNYVHQSINNQVSFSVFVFERNYKNLKIIHDTIKLTNSQLKMYSKDLPAQLDRFYYDLTYLLGANYFRSVSVDMIVSVGWSFSSVYGNFHRAPNYIIFKMNYLQASRKMMILIIPKNDPQIMPVPYCAIQLITNYQYKRQGYMCVSTVVLPVTGYFEKLYKNIDSSLVSFALARGFLSSLRVEDTNIARKKITQAVSMIYIAALDYYKKPEQIPDIILNIVMSGLALLKSIHAQPEFVNNSQTFDKIISQRVSLQFSGQPDVTNYISPYLFNLGLMDQTMCQEGQSFIYPPVVQMKFHQAREGIFLLDAGTSLYLFIAKNCPSSLLKQIIGKQKLSKNQQINEELIMNQQSFRACQVQTLIRFLRQQKSYGWVPLYIVRCGQNSVNQRNFYLFFYGQKYEQFRTYKFTLEQFIAIIAKPNSF